MWACEQKNFNIGVGNHQSIQAYELNGVQGSGHVNIKYVDSEAFYHRGM